MVPITWDKIGMKNLTKHSFFSTSTKTVPIKPQVSTENTIAKSKSTPTPQLQASAAVLHRPPPDQLH